MGSIPTQYYDECGNLIKFTPNYQYQPWPIYPNTGEWHILKPYKKEDEEMNLATLESEVTNACRSAEGILKDADTKLGQMSVTDKAKWAGIKIMIDTLYELKDEMGHKIDG